MNHRSREAVAEYRSLIADLAAANALRLQLGGAKESSSHSGHKYAQHFSTVLTEIRAAKDAPNSVHLVCGALIAFRRNLEDVYALESAQALVEAKLRELDNEVRRWLPSAGNRRLSESFELYLSRPTTLATIDRSRFGFLAAITALLERARNARSTIEIAKVSDDYEQVLADFRKWTQVCDRQTMAAFDDAIRMEALQDDLSHDISQLESEVRDFPFKVINAERSALLARGLNYEAIESALIERKLASTLRLDVLKVSASHAESASVVQKLLSDLKLEKSNFSRWEYDFETLVAIEQSAELERHATAKKRDDLEQDIVGFEAQVSALISTWITSDATKIPQAIVDSYFNLPSVRSDIEAAVSTYRSKITQMRSDREKADTTQAMDWIAAQLKSHFATVTTFREGLVSDFANRLASAEAHRAARADKLASITYKASMGLFCVYGAVVFYQAGVFSFAFFGVPMIGYGWHWISKLFAWTARKVSLQREINF